MTIDVLVAEDHGAVRAGLVLVLNNADGIRVVGEAANGAEAVTLARALRPDVALMDVRMPEVDGVAATRVLVSERLCEVLVLTNFDLDAYLFALLRSGAAGFLLKSVEAAGLIEAVRSVAAGDGVLTPRTTRRLISAFAEVEVSGSAHRPEVELDELTGREREVLACLGGGLTNEQIAGRLDIGEATVKTHVSRVLAKLNLHSRVQAALLGREAGLGLPWTE